MAKEISFLHVKIGPKLKTQYQAICKDLEMDMSEKTRELVANFVRSQTRQSGKGDKAEAN